MQQKINERMSKAEALTLVDTLKQSIAIGSLVAFGVLAGLVASHSIGNAASTTPANGSNSSQDQNTNNSGNYFQQQGNGYGFGSNNPSQQPFSHSRVS